MPLISIIIPAHNRETLLRLALDSVFEQSFQDFEIIVVDDGNDNTEQLVKNYCEKIKYIRLEHTVLPSVARNVGLQIAKSEYVAFLDSDDQWLPQKLERQIRVLNKYPKMGLICSNALVLSKNNKFSSIYLRNYQKYMSGMLLNELLMDNFVITSTCMVRRSILDRIGTFSEDPLLRVGEDYDLWLRIATISNICYIPEAFAIYRDQGNSIRSEQSRISYWNGMLLILEHIRKQIRDLGCQDILVEQIIQEKENAYRLRLIEEYLVSADYRSYKKYVFKLVRQRPRNTIIIILKLFQFIINILKINLRVLL